MDSIHALIIIGGFPPDGRALDHIAPHHIVICADSGLAHALELGLVPDVVVGDMDSVDPALLERIEGAGVPVLRASPDKDHTDTELAIAHALDQHDDRPGASRLTVLWGGGDRSDHTLGVIAACSDPALDALDQVELWAGADQMRFARPDRPVELECPVGSTVSLVPIGGPASGVRTHGLRWSLDGEDLPAGRARGVSNEAVAPRAGVRVDGGTLAVIVPSRTSGGLTNGATR